MRKLQPVLTLSALIFASSNLPVFAQDYAWQDFPVSYTAANQTTKTGKQAHRDPAYNGPGKVSLAARAAGLGDISVNPEAVSSAQFRLGFGNPGPQTASYGTALPPVATSSVDLSVCEATPPPPSIDPYSYGGGPSDPANSANLPPPPGPGYQPIFQHGVFVGYMSPELIAYMQQDPAGAWTQFANGSDWVGPEGLRLSLLAETGAASPEQMQTLYSMALFGM